MHTVSAISEAEVRAVQDGILHDVRHDGRALSQRRPFTLQAMHSPQSDGDPAARGNGVRVDWDGTVVVAHINPRVGSVSTQKGVLHLCVDAAPFLTHPKMLREVSDLLRLTFGPTCAALEETIGLAEAKPDTEENEADETTETGKGGEGMGGYRVGFPAAQLYIGAGHAFYIDADVYIQHLSGGNVATVAALAVHVALKMVKLPSIHLRPTPGGAVLVEVDPSGTFDTVLDWTTLPILVAVRVAPSRHYVMDPSALEESALPQAVYVAVNAHGQIGGLRVQQSPSRRGNAWRGEGEHEGIGGIGEGDLAALVRDAVFVGQDILAECEEVLRKREGWDH